MAANIKFDATEFINRTAVLLKNVEEKKHESLGAIAHELLRLSQFEVPHDTGMLQNSGHVEDRGNEHIVGYNKVYAARLHEHPEYRFQKGRKGKYLEDPMKNNLTIFLNFFRDTMSGAFV